jgi:molybdopterin-guanine dinucleotide biosynthesis protein A
VNAPGDGRFQNVCAAVLTGGASTRMGRDKSHLQIGGVAAAVRVSRLLATLFDDVLLVGGSPPDDAPGRRVADLEGPGCALRGVVGALDAARVERVLVVATDLPLLSAELVLALLAWPEADAVVPRTADGPHPLCALYRREPALALARRHLAEGRLKLQHWLEGMDSVYLEPAEIARVDPAGIALTNLNTPEDAARAGALLAGR